MEASSLRHPLTSNSVRFTPQLTCSIGNKSKSLRRIIGLASLLLPMEPGWQQPGFQEYLPQQIRGAPGSQRARRQMAGVRSPLQWTERDSWLQSPGGEIGPGFTSRL